MIVVVLQWRESVLFRRVFLNVLGQPTCGLLKLVPDTRDFLSRLANIIPIVLNVKRVVVLILDEACRLNEVIALFFVSSDTFRRLSG